MEVAVLVGGASPEHDVSLASAAQVLAHLDRNTHRVWPVLLTREGTWRVARRPLQPGEDAMPGPEGAAPCDAALDRWGELLPAMRPGTALDYLLDEARIDVVFPVLHGPFGEDGTVQGLLELSGIPFVGSGCAASAVAMDKLRTRQVYRAAGIRMPDAYEPSQAVDGYDAASELAAMERAIGLPAFAKVDASGSTVGVARITREADLAAFFAANGRRFRRWYAEQAVTGEEITVAVLGNSGDRPVALPPVGIYPVDDDWFTHDAKYRPGATEEIIPPRGLSPDRLREVQELAVRCHEQLVCDGLSRTDMIVTADGPVVLETNSIPGMTSNSLYPRAAKAAGYSFPALLDRLLELAMARPTLHDRIAGSGGATSQPASVGTSPASSVGEAAAEG